jgi:hypothetical protein
MARWRSRLGQLVLLLVIFGSGFLGARLGLLSAPVAQANHNFPDVLTGDFDHAFVDYLAQSGVTSGCGGGLFCPNDPVTRGQVAVFLAKLRVLAGCPPDSVRVGGICIDKYETSVWQTTNAALIDKIRLGTVTLVDLNAAGAQLRGTTSDNYPAGCESTGVGCTGLYAVSIPGVLPSRFMSWLQAVAFARNAGKRLPTNGEWQAAALGTPDGTPCVTGGVSLGQTGTAGCVSDAGAFDLVGNVSEWVDAWVPRSTASPGWGSTNDFMGLAGAATADGPGALFRGGSFGDTSAAGPLFVDAGTSPDVSLSLVGMRGAR